MTKVNMEKGWWLKMKKIEKPKHMEEHTFENSNEELAFLLYKAELNKELLSFWKSLLKEK